MRIISKKPLREFWAIHPEAESPLNHWFRIVSKTSFESFGDIRKTFPSAEGDPPRGRVPIEPLVQDSQQDEL